MILTSVTARTNKHSAVITNILRLYNIYRPGEQYVSFTETIFWTHIHGLIAVLCANLPVYKPLRAKIANFFAVIQRSFGSSFGSSRGNTRERIDTPSECVEPKFDLKAIPSDPSMNSHKHLVNYDSGEGTDHVYNNPRGANFSIADRGDDSVNHPTAPSHGIVRTRDVDVF